MKLFAGLLTVWIVLSCTPPKNAGGMNHANNPLAGTWVPTSQELGGNKLPAAVYQHQKMILSDSEYTVIAESVDKGVVKYDGNKIDIYGRDGVNAGKHFNAIYKYEGNSLTICYNLKGDGYPESFSTAGKPLYFMSIFKRLEE